MHTQTHFRNFQGSRLGKTTTDAGWLCSIHWAECIFLSVEFHALLPMQLPLGWTSARQSATTDLFKHFRALESKADKNNVLLESCCRMHFSGKSLITSRKLGFGAGIGLIHLLGMLDIACQGCKLSWNSLFFLAFYFWTSNGLFFISYNTLWLSCLRTLQIQLAALYCNEHFLQNTQVIFLVLVCHPFVTPSTNA